MIHIAPGRVRTRRRLDKNTCPCLWGICESPYRSCKVEELDRHMDFLGEQEEEVESEWLLKVSIFIIKPFSSFLRCWNASFYSTNSRIQRIDRSIMVAERSEDHRWVCGLILKVEGLCQSPLWFSIMSNVIRSLSASFIGKSVCLSRSHMEWGQEDWSPDLWSSAVPQPHPLLYHPEWASSSKEKKNVWPACKGCNILFHHL